MTLPTYVPRLGHNEVAMLPPGIVDDVTLNMFGAAIDPTVAQAYVDAVLTDRGGPSYEVIGSTALICFLESPRLSSAAQTIGYVADHEVSIGLPLAERDGDSLRFVVWMPYVFVDTDIAMASGREVWGFPKTIGVWTPPEFSLATTIFRTFADDTEGEWTDLIRVTTPPSSDTSEYEDLKSFMHGLGEAIGIDGGKREFSLRGRSVPGHSGGLVDDLRLFVDLVEIGISGKVPVVNLKQFRDAEDPTKACHQSIVDASLEIAAFHNAGILWGEHTIDLTECASHDLLGDIGFSSTSFTARFAAWVKMDFRANAGTTIWSAGV